jgi:hypothetical protein
MPKRRRFATRGELEQLLAGREPAVDWARALDALAAEGVDVATLVTIEVDEEVDVG